MPLINCEINFNLSWSANAANQATTFAIADAEFYVRL